MSDINPLKRYRVLVGALLILAVVIPPVSEVCRMCPFSCDYPPCEQEIICKQQHGFGGFALITTFFEESTLVGNSYACTVSREIDPVLLLAEWIFILGIPFIPRALRGGKTPAAPLPPAADQTSTRKRPSKKPRST